MYACIYTYFFLYLYIKCIVKYNALRLKVEYFYCKLKLIESQVPVHLVGPKKFTFTFLSKLLFFKFDALNY